MREKWEGEDDPQNAHTEAALHPLVQKMQDDAFKTDAVPGSMPMPVTSAVQDIDYVVVLAVRLTSTHL